MKNSGRAHKLGSVLSVLGIIVLSVTLNVPEHSLQIIIFGNIIAGVMMLGGIIFLASSFIASAIEKTKE